MWMLKLWSLGQCLFGSFPYILRDEKGFIVAEVFVISFLFSFAELYLCYTMNDICLFYKVPGSEPQLFGCYGVLVITAILIVNRIIMSSRTKQLMDTIFSRIPYPQRFFTISTYLAYFEGLSIILRLTCLLVSNPVMRQFSLLLLVLSSYTVLTTPLLIQSQFIFVCFFLQSGILKLNEILSSGAATDGTELRKIRNSMYKFGDYFEWALKVFRVDLFLSVGLAIICVVLSTNDLTLTIFKAEDVNITVPNYLMKISYFLIFDATEATCTVWLVYTALEILKSVSCDVSRNRDCKYSTNS